MLLEELMDVMLVMLAALTLLVAVAAVFLPAEARRKVLSRLGRKWIV